MPQLSVNEHVDLVIKLDLASRMKKHGFRKRTRSFVREKAAAGASPRAIQICEIKVGGSSSGLDGVVTATLALFYPELVPVLTPWQSKLPAQVKEVDGQVRVQVGALGPWKDAAHNWRIDSTTDDAALAKELADAVETFGLPFLDDMLDWEKISKCEAPGIEPSLRILALQKLGKRDDAKILLEQTLAARPKEYMAIASLAGRLKLPVPQKPAK
ncbi:hypothetical protein HY251_19240 [bacterium]|nr:hypothetical protein [bacterium]